MSYMAFHADADKALAGKFWGTKIPGEGGVRRDTGVQELVETLLQIMSGLGPIPLHRPLEFINHTNGPAINIYNDGDVDWMGLRVHDRRGNESQLGIGLGNENLLANEYIPHPDASIDPHDIQRFYSDLGGNAGRDRNHAQAIFANNGLFGLDIFAPWQPIIPLVFGGGCGNLKFSLGSAATNHIRGEQITYGKHQTGDPCDTGAVDPVENIENVCNLWFGCIEQGDVCLIAETSCGDDAAQFGFPMVVQAPTKMNFSLGATLEAIALGSGGDVLLDNDETVSATSPFCAIPEGVTVAVVRDVGASCGGWVILGATCPA